MTANPPHSADESRYPAALRPSNAVVLALVVAILDLEQRRARGKVRPPMDRRRIA